MSQSLNLNWTSTTLHLLNNLNLAIAEARLVSKIVDMSNQAGTIESTSGPSTRTRCLREEIKILENRLISVRDQKIMISDEQAFV
jgi:hypothetical protein